jgi:hypothetical protein
MNNNIRLSPKYGVNPSVQICFFCKESMGLALLGKLPDDTKAPREIILSYDPCDSCKEIFSKGVLLIEVNDKPYVEGQSPIQNGAYPNGSHWVISTDCAKKLFEKENIESTVALISPETAKRLGLHDKRYA